MAKRKRTAQATASSSKKQKQQHPHGEIDPDKEWKIKSIIGENAKFYHISWASDEETSQQYEDTWEPKKNVNQLAIDDWKSKKAAANQKDTQKPAETIGPGAGSGPAVPRRKRGRPRKVILSSPDPPEVRPPNNASDPANSGDAVEIGESQQSETGDYERPTTAESRAQSPLFVQLSSPAPVNRSHTVAVVHNPEPPSSYHEGAYEFVASSGAGPSSSPQFKKSPEPSQFLPDPAGSGDPTDQTSAATQAPTTPSQITSQAQDTRDSNRTSKVIPDSQIPRPSSSYVPSAITSNETSTHEINSQAHVEIQQQQLVSLHNQNHGNGATDTDASAGVIDSHSELTFADQASRPTDSAKNPRSELNSDSADSGHPRNTAYDQTKAPPAPSAEAVQAEAGAQSQAQALSRDTGDDNFDQDDVVSDEDYNSLQQPRQSIEQSGLNEAVTVPSGPFSSSQRAHGSNSAAAKYIDFTHTHRDRSSPAGSFVVTPPARKGFERIHLGATGQVPNSSAWLPPLPSYTPFKTQISPSQLQRSDDKGLPPRSTVQNSQTVVTQLSTISQRASSAPLAAFSPLLPPSQLPRPPSQEDQTDRAQPVPTTPKRTADMDKAQNTSSTGAMSLRERLNARRARGKAESVSEASVTSSPAVARLQGQGQPVPVMNGVAAVDTLHINPARLGSPALFTNDRARSPSAVPAVALEEVPTQEEMNTSERYGTLLPQAQSQQSDGRRKDSTSAVREIARTAEADPEKASLYTVPISLAGHQRDQYPQMVYYYRNTISRFLSTPDPDEELIQEAKLFVQRTRNIAMHPDLDNNEALSQNDVTASQQADWDISCSAKFRFIKDLVDNLHEQQLHIAVVSSPGRVVDMLRTFLSGIGAPPVSQTIHMDTTGMSKDRLKITLLSTEEDFVGDPADLVIGMDIFVRHDTSAVRKLRRRDIEWAPFVTLVVPFTVEHVERCLSPNLSDKALARALVNGIDQLKNDAGRLEEGQLSAKDAAVALANYMIIGPATEWPLMPLGTLHDLDSQTESEIEPLENGTVDQHGGHNKRLRDEEDTTRAELKNKRVRLASHDDDGVHDVTHISDSIEKSTQFKDEPVNALGQGAKVAVPPATETEQRLQQHLLAAQLRSVEHEAALRDLQYRHEEQRTELVTVMKERDSAISMAQNATSRLNESTTIRAKVNELQRQLEDANARLLNHSVPERAEFEALRFAAIQATSEKDKLEKRLEQMGKDLAYVRDLYQGSSSSAQQLATQNRELENKLAVAENKATGEHARLRQMGYDAYTKKLEKENKRLKQTVEQREEHAKAIDAELSRLKDASRGRMGTRGSSVPRSPRMSSPMKMGSRQGSPAAGDLRTKGGLLHPLARS